MWLQTTNLSTDWERKYVEISTFSYLDLRITCSDNRAYLVSPGDEGSKVSSLYYNTNPVITRSRADILLINNHNIVIFYFMKFYFEVAIHKIKIDILYILLGLQYG